MGGVGTFYHFTSLQIARMHRTLMTTSMHKYLVHTPCVPPPSNAVLWVTFDEPGGPLVRNAPGGNNGAVIGAPLITTAGLVGRARCFNGSSDSVVVPSYPAIDMGFDDITIEAWIKRGGSGVGREILVSKSGNPFNFDDSYHFFLQNGLLKFEFFDGDVGSVGFGMLFQPDPTSGTIGVVPNDGLWHHVAVAIDRDSSVGVQFYLDGAPVGVRQDPTPLFTAVSSGAPLRIAAGRGFGGIAGYFNGCVDEVGMYKRALGDAEILRIFTAGAAGKCKTFCQVPVNSPFCLATSSITVPARICNSTALPQVYMYWFESLPTSLGCMIDGPSLITPCSGMVTVQSGQCVDVVPSIDRPAGMSAAGITSCYRLVVQTLGTNNPDTISCTGSVVDRRDLCVSFQQGVYFGVAGIHFTVGPIMIANTSEQNIVHPYRILVTRGDMSPDTMSVRLNGLLPGVPVTGELVLASGASTTLSVSALFVAESPLEMFSLLIEADTDGDDIYEPIGSVQLQNIIPSSNCPCDWNADAILNSQDFFDFLSAFFNGKADFNNDGLSNSQDFFDFLGCFFAGCE